MKRHRILKLMTLIFFLAAWLSESNAAKIITPNDFGGTDTERIQKAIKFAKKSVKTITIPAYNANGTAIWKIDKAIRLPSHITIILDNCVLQLTDSCRDNMFRSDNVGVGITDPVWNRDIAILGVGNAILRGADNPRATGDGLRNLSAALNDPGGKNRSSYGSDAGKTGRKQKSDWRNFMILMGYVEGFKLRNVRIEYAHAWAVTFERVRHAEISNVQFYTPQFRTLNGQTLYTFNNDAINLREGCKYFRIDHITAVNGDDCIALSALDLGTEYHLNGNINAYQVTSTRHNGPEDDIEHIYITNIKTNYTGVAMRASDSASIHHVYINGLTSIADPLLPAPYGGSPYAVLLGNQGYGKPARAHNIHHIYAMNITGDGRNLIEVKSPLADCVFMNAIYTGSAAASAITYRDHTKAQSRDVSEINLVKAPATMN